MIPLPKTTQPAFKEYIRLHPTGQESIIQSLTYLLVITLPKENSNGFVGHIQKTL